MAFFDRKPLYDLPVAPENYEAEHLLTIEPNMSASEMHETERRFLNGLVRYYKPASILEVGVSRGGGSALLLNAIRDMPQTTLASIDYLDYYYRDAHTPVGDSAKKLFPEALDNQWTLITGKDPSRVLGDLGKTFDFAIIDTAHSHPIEVLNFLTVLPFLSDNAIVVIHDISLYIFSDEHTSFAPRMLWSTVVADKLSTASKYQWGPWDKVYNIGAFQITADTYKYIRNVFESLMYPWEAYPGDSLPSIRDVIEAHYSPELLSAFDDAAEYNHAWQISSHRTFSHERIKAWNES